MAVKLSAPDPRALYPVGGVELGVTAAAIRKKGARTCSSCVSAKVRRSPAFSRATASAPRRCSGRREHLVRERRARARRQHRQRERRHRRRGSGAARCDLRRGGAAPRLQPEQVLPFSTGVIMEPLPTSASTRRCRRRCAAGRGRLGRGRRSDHDDRHRAEGGFGALRDSAAAPSR